MVTKAASPPRELFQIEMPFVQADSRGPKGPRTRRACTLAPPDEYHGTIYAAATMRTVAAVNVTICFFLLAAPCRGLIWLYPSAFWRAC